MSDLFITGILDHCKVPKCPSRAYRTFLKETQKAISDAASGYEWFCTHGTGQGYYPGHYPLAEPELKLFSGTRKEARILAHQRRAQARLLYGLIEAAGNDGDEPEPSPTAP